MQLDILSPDQKLYSGEVERVQLPGLEGLFEVLNNHAPLMAALGDGQIRITLPGGEQQHFDARGGFVEVINNKVTVLV